jgi:hypothetical protein
VPVQTLVFFPIQATTPHGREAANCRRLIP